MSKEKRVNIVLEEDTHLKSKVIAVLKNITLNEFYEQAIRDAIEKNKDILDKIKK